MVEERERQQLSPYASLSAESEGRTVPEEPDPVRTCFQRDRDRILHSKPFRRLKHKTQVFIEPIGDHYRTRLTHSLEVSQISRTVARALRLNEDLTEAIALGHDVGHSPFGHAGERALDEVVKEEGKLPGFRHDLHSLRIVQVLTPLNLTQEVLSGMAGHSKGRADLADQDGVPTSTLEAAVVRVCDRIAYLNHDLDDSVRAGIVGEIPRMFTDFGNSHGDRIGRMVADLIGNSLDSPRLTLSTEMRQAMNEMKEWLFQNVYLAKPEPMAQVEKAMTLVKSLYRHYASPEQLGDSQAALDYVAGMTDRFAITTFESIFIPQRFIEAIDRVN